MLCAKIDRLEWSGVLFYTTKGVFGEEGFEIVAEEVYPLDIGSSTYTEYEWDDPEFIKWMMQNPHVLEMSKGHCHSHNVMDTFFSPTDMGELKDNAPHHNIYLSLIVNNENKNCAMVAFMVNEKTPIPERSLTTEVEFSDQHGNKKVKTYTIVSPAVTKEVSVMYTQECVIEYPSTVGGAITARFRQLLAKVTAKEDARKKAAAESYKHYPQNYGNNRGGGGFGRWNQPGLFDPYSRSDRQDEKAPKENDNKAVGSNVPRRTLLIAENVSGKKLLKDIENGTTKKVVVPMSSIYTQLPKSTKSEIYNMLAKLIALDMTTEDHLAKIMNATNFQYYPQGKRSQQMRTDANFYYDQMGRSARRFYANSFPDDKAFSKYNDVMMVCVEIIGTFDTNFPELAENITEVIKGTFKKQ